MKRLWTLLVTALLVLCFGAGQAAAEESDPGAAQASGQSADSGQQAGGSGGAYQGGATNRTFDIRVLSPGSSGDVTQSNTTTAVGVAANDNKTKQSVDQSQTGGGSGSDQTQVAGQEATSKQDADADATAAQIAPTNEAFSIRVLSPGSNGDVNQSNSATAGALAKNDNDTKQDTDQTQAGGGSGSDSTQIAGQDAANHQKADADATAVQLYPTNTASSIRVLSPGDDGDVTQSNSTTALAAGLNDNETKQTIDQSQGTAAPAPAKAPEPDAKMGQDGKSTGSDYTQVAGQESSSKQKADADATAVQVKPSNTAGSIRVLSPGDGGNVTQSNDATAIGIAKNDNETKQSIDQTQPGGYGSDYTQVAGQKAKNEQKADADATAVQLKPSNTASSIRVLSPGDDGDVEQSNSTTAIAAGLNDNETKQSIDQTQGSASKEKAPEAKETAEKDGHMDKGGSYTQVAGQKADNEQKADADATAVQLKPSNSNDSIRVGSKGDGGDVTQSNDATAVGIAKNDNETKQSIDQLQGSGSMRAKGPHTEDAKVRKDQHADKGPSYTQVAGQEADSEQKAFADATAVQVKPSNENSSIRVGSKGDDGDVEQSNSTTAIAAGLNDNETKQSIDQTQGSASKEKAPEAKETAEKDGHMDKGGSYTQVAGQKADNEQKADADATAVQLKPSNSNDSIRVGSKGDGGDVTQSNDATAVGIAKNDNETKQSIDQTQGSASKEKAPEAKETAEKDGHMDKGGSSYTQVAGQEADNEQKADADATAVQWKPSNSNDSIRVGSKGDGGDVTQSNDATAVGIAKNDNETKQSIDQTQGSTSKEKAPDSMDAKKDGYTDKGGSSYTQVAGQKADSEQKAFADATAVQVKPSNENSSIRVGSKGDDGDVEQSNSTTAIAAGLNDNETKQSIDQVQGGGSGSGYLQVAGQEAGSEQKADADAFALQVKPSNENAPVRVLSKGDDGDVSQSNSTTAIAAALNDNDTKQSIDQIQGGGRGHGADSVQVAGQGSWSRQKADADAAAIQLGASNENAPVREGSPSGRGGGSVEQSNAVGALALGLNHNTTKQSLEQWQYCPTGLGLQVGGQGSWTDQRAGAMTLALQGGMQKKKR